MKLEFDDDEWKLLLFALRMGANRILDDNDPKLAKRIDILTRKVSAVKGVHPGRPPGKLIGTKDGPQTKVRRK